MWIVRGQALALAMALSIRTSAAHVEATPRNGAAVLKTIFRYQSKVRLGRYFSWNFHISRRHTDHVVNGFRSRNDAKNQGSVSSMHAGRKRLHSFSS